MIETKGNFSKGRNLMKSKRAEALKEIRKLEKKYNLTTEESYRLEFYKKTVPVYSLSQNLTAKYEGLIVNSKLLIQFIKHLKDMNWEISIEGDTLKLQYLGKNSGGLLEVYDVSPYFEDFNDIPEMKIEQ